MQERRSCIGGMRTANAAKDRLQLRSRSVVRDDAGCSKSSARKRCGVRGVDTGLVGFDDIKCRGMLRGSFLRTSTELHTRTSQLRRGEIVYLKQE